MPTVGFGKFPSKAQTTFILPAGRYCLNKLPFGISSAPEVFQKRMETILDRLPGVVCKTDDVLVFGDNQEEHDQRLTAVLERLEAANVTLNWEKYKFKVAKVNFLGHVVDRQGIRADQSKTTAILQMKAPTNGDG